MIDIKYIRENKENVENASKAKKYPVDLSEFSSVDESYTTLLQEVQSLREQRNKIAKEASTPDKEKREQAIEEGKKIKETLEEKEKQLSDLKSRLDTFLLQIPNLPKSDVKVGKDESENDVVRTFKTKTEFSFTPKDHLELGEKLDIIDVQRASKVSGARFNYLKNEGVLLEFALVQLAMKTLMSEGFIPVVPPVLVNTEVMRGMGYMEHGGDEDMFVIPKDEMVLVGTAEHSIVPMHKDEILSKKQLPLRYVGFSTAFRREAGSYGKDTKGIIRVHQFDKVEMVSYVPEGEDDTEHELLLSLEEKLFQFLDIPYQVVKMCTGDLGFPTARKYDIEAWIPSQDTYREVTSASTITDFQSRRLNIKYQDGSDKKYAQVLNGTAFAIGRTIVAILENYQNEDGSVRVPDVLKEYLGKDVISPK